ncbi:VanZ family protein [Streptomyces zhaozhouensis]|uniref:VanZ family protein n=1 Tax=Streptomyces zhaozhouensis TaxID=1300267 RepID=UPI001484CB7B|nr:VanZ family protein [Streptomyces zhaozhouensis]
MRPHPAGSAEPTPPAGHPLPANPTERGGRLVRVPARTRLVASALLCCYLLLAAWLALRPLTMLWVSPANLEPLSTIRADLARGPEEAGRTLAAGLVRLAPLGVLLPLVGARLGGGRMLSLARTGFVGAMVSMGLECGQTLAPSRVADIDSVLLNTLGVALTHQLCYGTLRRLARPAAPPADAPPESPTPPAAPAPERRPSPRPSRRAPTRCPAAGTPLPPGALPPPAPLPPPTTEARATVHHL